MTEILVSEVGPRDGLQSIDRVMPLEAKKAWIAAEAAAGVKEIEVGSFVPPSLLPQMADTAELVAFARTFPGLNVVALVPNAKGAARAVEAGVHAMSIPFSMSETHSLRNVRKDHPAMLAEIAEVAQIAKTGGVHFAVGLSTAFGCTIEGAVSEEQVVRLAAAAAEAGAQEFSLSDTTGYADPAQVKRLIRKVRGAVGDKLTTLHLHNTRGLGLANALAGLEEGITTLDASLGGLGGCPYAPGASGNLVTEDLVLMLNSMGLKTGIDLAKLLEVRQILTEALPGEPLYGFTPDAGPMLDYNERLAR
ncbi:hydroxymethylglutaryl-CoA lyase [Novosphingobium sp.]|uniref:hydroxymethylglutaryl-CoA lyase n=1 Tax=Novosphingobium sp. TaxID=1874826 RepID=UPI0022C625C5|nr:hydroxymethylglutaryl-CoA lyase [Novosphingobium sp.]MCZ8019457.1 hydroxymethylglutaryl-CoA lyase [Novosphingobium sp.]MCZ8035272.1 hydroxymethylglutaryl-CoA lyase [Novosphingobium sp.]MCZ8050586.1 hydroxymethylglutaryl-CoA lyase [Novosphingobium sp.]MCZ8058932.1 hydroxymethylglutaryl-CoA lyase [Novosphingobium sp.]MCZ8232377.1 hydroxymethylglutaryl-CoA lyase [Novosphingobium sp.]